MCELLRGRYPPDALPIIMLSAKTSEDNVVQGFQSGCNDYITKPFSQLELLARINMQLKLRRLWSTEVCLRVCVRYSVCVCVCVCVCVIREFICAHTQWTH